MKPTSTSVPGSSRLRCDVAIHATATGHVVTVDDEHHLVRLAHDQAEALVAALVDEDDTASTSSLQADPRLAGPPAAALASLVAAGWADPVTPRVTVEGEGTLASAVRAALVRMGARGDCGESSCAPTPGAVPTLRVRDDPWPHDVPAQSGSDPESPEAVRGCWVEGHHVVLSPPVVAPDHVAARRSAARRHQSAERLLDPLPGRGVRSLRPALDGPGLEYAAVVVAAEMVRPAPAPTEAVLINLVTLTTTRHPVVAVPRAPR